MSEGRLFSRAPTRLALIRLRETLSAYNRARSIVGRVRDALMAEARSLMSRLSTSRGRVEEELAQIYSLYWEALASSRPGEVEAGSRGRADASIVLRRRVLRGLVYYEAEAPPLSAPPSYSLSSTSPLVDAVVSRLQSLHGELVSLANMEQVFLRSVEKLRFYQRLLNILDHILIPRVREELRYVGLMLDDLERQGFSMLKRFKELRSGGGGGLGEG